MAICQSARKLKMKITSTAKSIYHKIYPKDDFQKSLATIKKCLTLVITWVGESNLYSFLGGNGRGVSRKLSGNQEGVVGEHKLPDNCIVIAAGNRTTDKSVAYKMPKALANRLMHIEIEGSFNSWKKWAISSGINDKVIGFLSFRQNYLMDFNSSSDDLSFPTPRSWEMVSNILNGIDDDIDNMYSLVAGIIGTGVAVEFRTWAKVYKDLPAVEDIFDGKMPALPTNTDAMYALTATMTAYARSHKDEMVRIAHSIRYADKMPPDFSTVLMKDYMYIDKDYKERLMLIPEFAKWLQSKGSLMNGSVR